MPACNIEEADCKICLQELTGDHFRHILQHIANDITFDRDEEIRCRIRGWKEINDSVVEWLMIQQELTASTAKPIPPHCRNTEDGFLEMHYEDRFELGVD